MKQQKIDPPTLILIIILIMALINGLTSCTTSRVTYQQDMEGKVWRTHSDVSTMTGLKYKK